MYFEIYNDGEKGFIIEDTLEKKALKNMEILKLSDLIEELQDIFKGAIFL